MEILLVEDDDDLMQVLIENLSGRNRQFYTAQNGIEALEMIKSQHFDIVISDIQMPKMDGVTLYKRVKDVVSSTHYILFSGNIAIADSLAESQLFTKISKPIDFDLIERIISGHEAPIESSRQAG